MAPNPRPSRVLRRALGMGRWTAPVRMVEAPGAALRAMGSTSYNTYIMLITP